MMREPSAKFTILVDFDDTLNNFLDVWVEYLNETHGTTVKKEDIKEWDITKAFPTINVQDIFSPLRTEEFWERVKPLPGAVEYLQKLIDDGHNVCIVTASHPETVTVKLNSVLFKYFPYLSYKNVIVAYQKHLIKGQIIIDDSVDNILGGFRYLGLLMDAPHNASCDVINLEDGPTDGVIRVNNWEEIYRIITEYANTFFII